MSDHSLMRMFVLLVTVFLGIAGLAVIADTFTHPHFNQRAAIELAVGGSFLLISLALMMVLLFLTRGDK